MPLSLRTHAVALAVLVGTGCSTCWAHGRRLQSQSLHAWEASHEAKALATLLLKRNPGEAFNPSNPASSPLSRRALLVGGALSFLVPMQAANAVEAKNPVIALLTNLLPGSGDGARVENAKEDPLDAIAWDATKARGLSTETMAARLKTGLSEREWFVTGRGLPELFSERFKFSDPQVSLEGIEPYCRQVRRLFDQETARCEVVCCAATAANTITVVWRNSGKVNLGPGIELKPYVVTTTLRTDPTDGLIISQEDAFQANGPINLVLYQVPALRSLLPPPAPSVAELRQQYDAQTCKLIV